MTTGRKVVVPGQQGPPNPVMGRPGNVKPQSIVLREFELLYTIEYRAPANEVVAEPPNTDGGVRPTRPDTILDPRNEQATLDPGGGQPTQPCRQL
jgi:hypothetical protein